MIRTEIIPRVSETDGAGHINNVFVPVWFEAGRREIFRVLTPDLSFANWRAVLVNMNVDYEDQIYLHQSAEVRTWVEKIGSKSFTVAEEIWQGDRLCAKGRAVYVNFNVRTQASEIISEQVAAQLKAL